MLVTSFVLGGVTPIRRERVTKRASNLASGVGRRSERLFAFIAPRNKSIELVRSYLPVILTRQNYSNITFEIRWNKKLFTQMNCPLNLYQLGILLKFCFLQLEVPVSNLSTVLSTYLGTHSNG